jgi:predicted RNA-binding Zn-ribbon protein involved in translation (DUF1610 family)
MQKYKCECGWIGTEKDMDADAGGGGISDEAWSNWICPSCREWWWLEDYEKVTLE